jgi:hypothetical protein
MTLTPCGFVRRRARNAGLDGQRLDLLAVEVDLPRGHRHLLNFSGSETF